MSASDPKLPQTPSPPIDADADALRRARETFARLGPAGVLAAVFAALPLLGSALMIWYVDAIAHWLLSLGDAAIPAFVAIFALTAGLAIANTWTQAIIAGWAFKFPMGLWALLAGVFFGSLIGYVVARRASGERVMRLIEEHPKWRTVHQALLGGGFCWTLLIVTLLRLPPNSPFALCNLVLAATKVRWHTYILGTLIGVAPRSAFLIYMASQANSPAYKDDKLTFVIGIGVTIAVLVILGALANQALARVTGAPDAPSRTSEF